MHDRLCRVQPLVPWQYVRLLFSMLRNSSFPAPTVDQLASSRYLNGLSDYLSGIDTCLRTQFAAESQLAKHKIVFLNRGSGYSFPSVVYYVVVDRDLGLSPLFRYSLAYTAADSLRSSAKGGDEPATGSSSVPARGGRSAGRREIDGETAAREARTERCEEQVSFGER